MSDTIISLLASSKRLLDDGWELVGSSWIKSSETAMVGMNHAAPYADWVVGKHEFLGAAQSTERD